MSHPSISNLPSGNVHAESAYPPGALIITFLRKKQKQIYGIIGGLQSGIRNARQQTEDLQNQLDSLQAALGMDFEDAGD